MLNIVLYFWVSNHTRQVPLVSVPKVIFTYKTIPQVIEAHTYVYFMFPFTNIAYLIPTTLLLIFSDGILLYMMVH